MCLLKGHNLLGINSCSHSFGSFFSFIFLKNTKNLWVLSKITLSLLSLDLNERIQFLKYFLSHRSKFSSLSLCFCLGFFFFFFFLFFFFFTCFYCLIYLYLIYLSQKGKKTKTVFEFVFYFRIQEGSWFHGNRSSELKCIQALCLVSLKENGGIFLYNFFFFFLLLLLRTKWRGNAYKFYYYFSFFG